MKTKITVALSALLIVAVYFTAGRWTPNRPADFRDAPASDSAINALSESGGEAGAAAKVGAPARATDSRETEIRFNTLKEMFDKGKPMSQSKLCTGRRSAGLFVGREIKGNLIEGELGFGCEARLADNLGPLWPGRQTKGFSYSISLPLSVNADLLSTSEGTSPESNKFRVPDMFSRGGYGEGEIRLSSDGKYTVVRLNLPPTAVAGADGVAYRRGSLEGYFYLWQR
ncbi:MAG: hypothetical protein A2X28_08245 [Elusimicrobia bacterium GWA2_56_46]|nr:MAG: hypothetical protein A2X28_08245 [Elusimicrobia bacterium GWA2_56_46]OGR55132.1 MAG: hypothetical protein A2X39_01150 [Elusimicrobia bacterium GWC2_56_31]HBW22297.1 hypothetical protein [Elusimicrobiota bacterium]